MDNKSYFSAKEARELSTSIISGQFEKELDYIYKLINDAIYNGKYEVSFSNKTLLKMTKEFLKDKGFKIDFFYGDQRDPCDITTISW